MLMISSVILVIFLKSDPLSKRIKLVLEPGPFSVLSSRVIALPDALNNQVAPSYPTVSLMDLKGV